MMLYKRKVAPFPLRLLGVIFHPGLLFLPAFAVLLIWLGSGDSIAAGIYITSGLLIAMYGVATYMLIRRIRSIITSIETKYRSLCVTQSDTGGVHTFEIPVSRLDADLVVRSGRRRTLYFLTLKDKGDPSLSFTLEAASEVIGYILNGLESEELAVLSPEEKKFAAQYRSNVDWEKSSTGKTVKYAIWLIAAGFIFYNLYRSNGTILTIYYNLLALRSPVTGVWQGEIEGQRYELGLRTDSTLFESLFGQTGSWSYRPDSVAGHEGDLSLCNASGTCLSYKVDFKSPGMMRLTGNNLTIIFSKRDQNSREGVVDSLQRFIQAFEVWPVPVSREAMRPFLRFVIPESKEPPDPVKALLKEGPYFIGWMSSNWNPQGNKQLNENQDMVVIIDLGRRKRTELYDATTECSDMMSVAQREHEPILVHSMDCDHGGRVSKREKYYSVSANGTLRETDGNGL